MYSSRPVVRIICNTSIRSGIERPSRSLDHTASRSGNVLVYNTAFLSVQMAVKHGPANSVFRWAFGIGRAGD
jgi:hypothetical protein